MPRSGHPSTEARAGQPPSFGTVKALRFMRSRSAVELWKFNGPRRKTLAGGVVPGRVAAAIEEMRNRAKRRAAGEKRLLSAIQGRETTATGTSRMIWVQPRQRWKLARLSAPMIQTNFTPGNRAFSERMVAMV